jgi:hypothetical protein
MTPFPSDPIGRIRRHLADARRRLALGDILSGALWFAGVAAAAWVTAAALEAVLWLPSGVRATMLAVVAAGSLAFLLRMVAWPALRWSGLVRGISDDTVAGQVGRRLPEVRDRLLNLLQLLDGRHSDAPEPLVRSAADHLGRRLQDVDLASVEDFAGARRAGRLASLPLVGLLAFVAIAPGAFFGASSRLLAPARDFSRPAPYAVEVGPGDVELVKGADLAVTTRISGSGFPATAVLETRYPDETVIERLELPLAGGEARHTLVNVRRTTEYRVSAGTVASPWFTARVVDRPVVGNLQVLLRYPSYTRMPPLALAPNEGDITALAGTEVLVEAVVGGPPIREARLVFGRAAVRPLDLDGRLAAGSFRVTGDDTWHVEAVSDDDVANLDPVVHDIRRVEDARPAVAVVSPESEFDLDESASVPLAWRISDDFGFSALRLWYRLESSRFGTPSEAYEAVDLPLERPAPREQDGAIDWLLRERTSIDPAPGDVIVYYLEVTDNDGFSGPKSSRTEEYRLRLPSLVERYEALDETEDAVEEDLEGVKEESTRMREAFDELQEQLRGKPAADWQDERAVERLQQRQESMEESVREISGRIESMTEEMERNDLVGEETLEMFRELQEVAEEINSPELMEALQELQEAMQQMDLPRMQEAMEDFRFNEEEYRQRLERTLELFRNLRVQQDLDEAARRAEELARTEEELAERTEELEREQPGDEENPKAEEPGDGDEQEGDEQDGDEQEGDEQDGDEQEGDSAGEDPPPSNEQLAREQERAAEEMEKLEEMLRELQERMEGLKQAPSESMQNLSKQTESQQMPQQMRQNAEQLQNQQLAPAKQSQQEMSEQLRQLQQQLQKMLSGMQGSQMEMNLSGLRRALDDVLALSEDQEALRAEVQVLADESPGLRESARRQVQLGEGLNMVSDSLQSLARQVPQMGRDIQTHAGEALREMADATQSMTDRTGRRAVGHQKGAMTQLNELALLLADLMNQMMGGGGGSGSMSMQQMLQQLQNMAGQQEMLNQQMQQLLNDIRGNRLSSNAQERLRQLGEQQQLIREQLRDLNRNRELRNQALGDLERIAEQMQETIEELTLRQVTPRTIERQRQILTRLLEASRSLQERGRDRRRESRTGEDVLRQGPPELTAPERADQLRRDLIRALESGYAPDFEELIRRYFELLQQDAAGSGGAVPPDSTGG